MVDTLEFMADASDLPILLDGDTGYGNFNNVRWLVKKPEQRGIADVCIEDKQFPKTNIVFSTANVNRSPRWTNSAARSRPARTRRAIRISPS